MRPKAIAWESPSTQKATVCVSKIRVDQSGQDKGVHDLLAWDVEALTEVLTLQLVEDGDVVLDPVMEDHEPVRLSRFGLKLGDVFLELVGAELEDFTSEIILADPTVKLADVLKESVRLNVRSQHWTLP